MEGNKSSVNINNNGYVSDSSSTVLQSNTFRSAYDNVKKRFYMPFTPNIVPVYSKRVDKFGAITFEATGEVDQYAEIQKYAEDTDIKSIICNMSKEGTLDLLSARKDQMVDVSDLPDDYIGLFNLGLALQEEFDKLSVEDRAAFNNSYIAYADNRIKGTDKDIILNARKIAEDNAVKDNNNGGDNNV